MQFQRHVAEALELVRASDEFGVGVFGVEDAPRDVDDLFLHLLLSQSEGGEKEPRSIHAVQAMDQHLLLSWEK